MPPKMAAPAEHSLSNSEKRTFTTCRKKWYWQYGRKLVPLATPTPFLVGSAFHKCLQMFYEGRVTQPTDIQETVDSVFDPVVKGQNNAFLSEDQLEDIEKQRAMLQGMVEAYFKVYADDLSKWEIVGVEREGKWSVTPRWDMYFTVDMLVKSRKTGQRFVVEHKTTAAIDHNYVSRLALDDQVSTYLVGAKKAFGFDADGVIYNAVMKPRIRQKQNETREDYLNRVVALYQESPQEYLYRATLLKCDRDLKQFEEELAQFTGELDRAAALGFYYKNTDACTARGTCPYMPLCLEGETATDRFKVREHKSQYGAEADSD